MENPEKSEKPTKSEIAKREEKILKFWQENKIFEKSLEKNKGKKEFVFYEGPPTANGRPGIHHLEARAFKDLYPRYKTMRGYNVRRKGGWDTHGLPVEIEVEKKLGFVSKQQIEEYGIEKFNKKCKESVWEYVDEWQEFTKRIGYWVDLENPYITYKSDYMESLWNIVKVADEKKLLYKDHRIVPWCARCGTGLSSHEVADGYKDIKDLSVIVEMELVDDPGIFALAWTTTPWTLPGNTALAVGNNIDYVVIQESESPDKKFILAKDTVEKVFQGKNYSILEEKKGKDIVGKKYKPLFDYYQKDSSTENFENGWKIYAGDFVNLDEGTGIVHMAPAFGEDDLALSRENKLPFIQHVTEDGKFKNEVTDFAGQLVKPKEDHQAADIEIIKKLAGVGKLFFKEKIEHTYPHCWRCKTPLIYYAREAWYIRMTELRDQMVSENEKIHWEPNHIREGRFGEWLRGIKDWSISRERYWATPLPVWEKQDGDYVVIGSVADLRKYAKKSGNKYFAMRHGQSDSNVQRILSCQKDRHGDKITEEGKKQVMSKVSWAKENHIDLIITSPMTRTRQTADILAKELGIEVVEEPKVGEINLMMMCGKDLNEYHGLTTEERIAAEERGDLETWDEVRTRAAAVLYELENEYKEKNILIISHDATLRMLEAGALGYSHDDAIKNMDALKSFANAEVRKLDFVPLPHGEDYSLDLHKPYVDEIELVDENGEKMKRVNYVMDVWFDSGAMPFAQNHYPFENENFVNTQGYPADFISEAVDQTRGWFYTLHAIGAIMGKGLAYKNVICLGHLLDAEGKKMSKSIGNIVNPWEMIDKHGVDALRFWMYTVNQPGDSKNFDEKTVVEINNKVFNFISNSLQLYKLYNKKSSKVASPLGSKNILDKWIMALFDKLVVETQNNLDNYKVFEAARGIRIFAGELSQWYVRSSRSRIKSDSEDSIHALATLRYILFNLAKVTAPFSPFFAEQIYQELKNENDPTSVHLTDWPETKSGFWKNLFGSKDAKILDDMQKTRDIISLALEARSSAGIKVRQPLRKLSIPAIGLDNDYFELIKDEVNVKEVAADENLEKDQVVLDQEIDGELREEGAMRELIRSIQSLRKNKNLSPDDLVDLKIKTNQEGKKVVEKFRDEIEKTTGLKAINFLENIDNGTEITDGDYFWSIEI